MSNKAALKEVLGEEKASCLLHSSKAEEKYHIPPPLTQPILRKEK